MMGMTNEERKIMSLMYSLADGLQLKLTLMKKTSGYAIEGMTPMELPGLDMVDLEFNFRVVESHINGKSGEAWVLSKVKGDLWVLLASFKPLALMSFYLIDASKCKPVLDINNAYKLVSRDTATLVKYFGPAVVGAYTKSTDGKTWEKANGISGVDNGHPPDIKEDRRQIDKGVGC